MTETTKPTAAEYLSEPQLRRRLGYSRSTIRKLRKLGMPHVASDRLRRYAWNEVLAWLSKRA